MKHDIEIIQNLFTDHVADLKVLNEDTQVMIWKNPHLQHFQLRFVFFNKMLFVDGGEEFSDAVFNFWDYNPKTGGFFSFFDPSSQSFKLSLNWKDGWQDISVDIMEEACTTIQNGKSYWDAGEAIAGYSAIFWSFTNLHKDQYDELISYFLKTPITNRKEFGQRQYPYKDQCDDEIIYQLALHLTCASRSLSAEDLQNRLDAVGAIFPDLAYNEMSYLFGEQPNPDFAVYLWVLQAAYKQLYGS